MKKSLALTAAIAAALSLGSCAVNEEAPSSDQAGTSPGGSPTAAAATLAGVIDAGGSSAQTAAQEAWRAGFQAAHPQVTVNYDPTGSGTGRQNFADGGYLVAGTDAAFRPDETAGPFAACAAGSALVEVPAYISPIVLGFTLDQVEDLKLDAATIARIFTGEVTRWDDPAIAGQNPGLALPATAITPVHRSDDSGTTENFTDYLFEAADGVWTWEADQSWPAELAGEAAEKTQGVRETVASTPGAIGYLDASQAAGLGTVAVKVGDDYVRQSAEAAAAAVGASPLEAGRLGVDLVVDLDRTPAGQGVYPLVLVSYLAACQTYADPQTGALVRAYLQHVVSDQGQAAAAANAGSAPLGGDPDLAAKAAEAVAGIR